MPEVYEATREAECALIGSILIEGSRKQTPIIAQLKGIIEPSDFLDASWGDPDNQHARIFTAMLQCIRPHQINTAQKMNDLDLLRPGDISHMSACIAEVPCSLDYIDYARAIANYSLERQRLTGGSKVKSKYKTQHPPYKGAEI